MVYEKKCAECERIVDFGGEEDGRLPDDAIEFNDEVYCRKCVRELVEFGAGDVVSRMEAIEQEIKKIKDELGMERHL